jgi:hypothetical protein
MRRNRLLHTCFRFSVSFPAALAWLDSPEGPHPPLSEKRRNGNSGQSRAFRASLTDTITPLHTYFRFPMSLPGSLAWLESPEGAPAPIGEKTRNGKKSQRTMVRRFWMHKNRRLHTYLRFAMSLPGFLPWLESPHDAPAPIGEKRRNGKKSQPTTIGRFLIHSNRRLHTYLRFAMSTPTFFACFESPEGVPAPIGEKRRNGKMSQPRAF